MEIRNKINEIIDPKSENALSRAYDWLMLIAIVVGILPLMFRKQYQIFWYFDFFPVPVLLLTIFLGGLQQTSTPIKINM